MRELLRPILLGAALAAAAPQAAQAAELAPLDPCYRSVDSKTRETVTVRGKGFTPGEQVSVAIDGVVVDTATVLPNGEVEGQVTAPYQERGERPFTLTLTEVDQPANTASAASRVTALALRLKPRKAAPSQRVRFIGRGFTDGDGRLRALRPQGQAAQDGPPRRRAGPVRADRRPAPPDPDQRGPPRAAGRCRSTTSRPTAPSPSSVFVRSRSPSSARCAPAARRRRRAPPPPRAAPPPACG